METGELISICFSAFLAVFLLLAGLAVLMQIIIKIFPEKIKADDVTTYAAIASTFAKMYPGTQIKKIEELS